MNTAQTLVLLASIFFTFTVSAALSRILIPSPKAVLRQKHPIIEDALDDAFREGYRESDRDAARRYPWCEPCLAFHADDDRHVLPATLVNHKNLYADKAKPAVVMHTLDEEAYADAVARGLFDTTLQGNAYYTRELSPARLDAENSDVHDWEDVHIEVHEWTQQGAQPEPQRDWSTAQIDVRYETATIAIPKAWQVGPLRDEAMEYRRILGDAMAQVDEWVQEETRLASERAESEWTDRFLDRLTDMYATGIA